MSMDQVFKALADASRRKLLDRCRHCLLESLYCRCKLTNGTRQSAL